MPVPESYKMKFNAICFEYNNNEDTVMIYNMIVDLLTTCNPNALQNNAVNELNHIIERFTLKNDNNIKYNIESIIEDFILNDKYRILRAEFC